MGYAVPCLLGSFCTARFLSFVMLVDRFVDAGEGWEGNEAKRRRGSSVKPVRARQSMRYGARFQVSPVTLNAVRLMCRLRTHLSPQPRPWLLSPQARRAFFFFFFTLTPGSLSFILFHFIYSHPRPGVLLLCEWGPESWPDLPGLGQLKMAFADTAKRCDAMLSAPHPRDWTRLLQRVVKLKLARAHCDTNCLKSHACN